jgi:hypothetical protein
MRKATERLAPKDLFDYLKMFNQVVIMDEDLAARLPMTEFELSFNQRGDIYVNHLPLRVNVKKRYEALVGR